jgi:hypothetical protein
VEKAVARVGSGDGDSFDALFRKSLAALAK